MHARWVAACLLVALAGLSTPPQAQEMETIISPARRSEPPPPPPSLLGTTDTETRFWNQIRDSSDIRDFEAYLRQYPAGAYAAPARERIAVLERPALPAPTPATAPNRAPGPVPPPAREAAPAAPPEGLQQAVEQERRRNEAASAQIRLPQIYGLTPERPSSPSQQVPAPRPDTALAAVGHAYRVVTNANLREQPSTEAARIGNVVAGERVTVVGRAPNPAWLQIEKNGRVGFVIARALVPQPSESPAAALPDSRGPDRFDRPAPPVAAPAVAAVLPPPGAAAADPDMPATEFLQDAAQRAQSIIEEPGRSDPERRAKFRSLFLDGAFDIRAMAQFVLGPSAARYTPGQLDEFTRALADYMVYAYWTNLRTSFGWQMEIGTARILGARGAVPVAAWPNVADGQPVQIDSVVTSAAGQRTPVQWQIVRRTGGWRIVDVATVGVSLMRLHRDDIGSQLQKSGNDLNRLIATLREKSRELELNPQPPPPPPAADRSGEL